MLQIPGSRNTKMVQSKVYNALNNVLICKQEVSKKKKNKNKNNSVQGNLYTDINIWDWVSNNRLKSGLQATEIIFLRRVK